MHISQILTQEQIKFYIKFFKALDKVEGIHKATADEMAGFDFNTLFWLASNVEKFKAILQLILPHRGKEVETEGTEIKVVISEFEDRWACYRISSKNFFRRYEVKSLGTWAAIRDVAYRVQRDDPADPRFSDHGKTYEE